MEKVQLGIDLGKNELDDMLAFPGYLTGEIPESVRAAPVSPPKNLLICPPPLLSRFRDRPLKLLRVEDPFETQVHAGAGHCHVGQPPAYSLPAVTNGETVVSARLLRSREPTVRTWSGLEPYR